jgi:plastocyanin
MHIQHIILASGLVMIAGCQTIGGDSMPTLTRTGEVKDVIISERVEPTSLTVNAGDEIRWINKRRATVQVIFLKPMTENLACQRNFGGPLGFGTKRNEYTAKIGSNKTASVCFREPGEVNYVDRVWRERFQSAPNIRRADRGEIRWGGMKTLQPSPIRTRRLRAASSQRNKNY